MTTFFKHFFLISIGLSHGAWASESLTQPDTLPIEGRWQLKSGLEYFSSKANYDSGGGSYQTLGSGRYYRQLQANFLGSYDFSDKMTFLGNFTYAFAQSHDGKFDRENGEVSDIGVGVQYHFLMGKLRWTPELLASYPLNPVKLGADNVLTGEGAWFVQPGTWLYLPVALMDFYSYLGAKYQGEGRATLLPWRVGTQAQLRSFLVGGELAGFQTLIKDSSSITPTQRTEVHFRNGNSQRYFAKDPSLMEAKVFFGHQLNQIQAQLGYSKTLNGKNAAEGDTIFFNIAFASSTEKTVQIPTRAPPSRTRRQRQQRALEQFETQEQEYDETLFLDEADRQRLEQIRQRQQERERQRRLREQQRRQQPQPQEPDVDQLFKEVEDSLTR